MAVERYAQHGQSQKEGNVLPLLVQVVIGLIDSPDDDTDEKEDIDNLASIERAAQDVDEEQLEPAAYLYDARDDAIEYGGEDDNGDAKGNEATLKVAFRVVGRELAIIIDQHDGRQAQQVQQVYANGESCHIHDKHQPAVGMGLVGLVLPLEDKPEDDGGEGRRVGIHFTLDSREPEGVAEGIDEGAHHG